MDIEKAKNKIREFLSTHRRFPRTGIMAGCLLDEALALLDKTEEGCSRIYEANISESPQVEKRSEIIGLIKVLELYGNTESQVSKNFYQGLCFKAKEAIEKQAEQIADLKAEIKKLNIDLKSYALELGDKLRKLDDMECAKIDAVSARVQAENDFAVERGEFLAKLACPNCKGIRYNPEGISKGMCPYCGGKGTLLAAYENLKKQLAEKEKGEIQK